MKKNKKKTIIISFTLSSLVCLYSLSPVALCHLNKKLRWSPRQYGGVCELNFIARVKNPDLIERQQKRFKKNFVSTLERCNGLLMMAYENPDNKEIRQDLICQNQVEMIEAIFNPRTYQPVALKRYDHQGIDADAYMNPFEIAFFPKEKLWKIKSKGFFTSLDFDDHIQEIPVPIQEVK